MVINKDSKLCDRKKDEGFKALYPFKSHFFQIEDGFNLHYVDEGSGDAVVMLHGNPTWSFYYRRAILNLRDKKRVIVPDHIGCGFSDKPQKYAYTLRSHINNLENLLNSLMIKKLSLVLHDWGGPIGMGYACRNPEKIDKIVVLNTSCFFSSRIPFRIRICRIPGFGPIAVRGFNAFALAALRMAVNHHERMTPEIKRGFVLPYDSWENRIAVLRFVQDIPRSEKDDTFIVIKEIEEKLGLFKSTPILIQWGTLDWCFDKSFLKGWTDRFPQADVDVYEDAAHYVLEDAHERILPHIRDFL